jgi:hypothetical protein
VNLPGGNNEMKYIPRFFQGLGFYKQSCVEAALQFFPMLKILEIK